MRRRSTGFTIVELSIVLSVVVILAALVYPLVLGQVERARAAAETDSLAELAKVMKRFHVDVGGWPLDDRTWDEALDLEPDELTAADTALFSLPVGVPVCTAANAGEFCWSGPYLSGEGSLGAATDAWGRPRMIAMIRPFDGGGGGSPSAPDGAIVVWSRGPDGLDDTGCYGAPSGCVRDLALLVQGLMSNPAGDDVVRLVGPVR